MTKLKCAEELRAEIERLHNLLLNPTDEMLDAGRKLQSLGDEDLDRDDMRLKWLAMVRAALGSKP